MQRIYNLASPTSPPHYQRDPVRTTLINVIGTRNALDLGRRHHARVLQASTSEVYGDPEVHPQPESYRGSVDSTGLRACYDEGKRCAESLVMDYKRRWRLEVRLPRIFNTYGPRMAEGDGRVVSNFIVQALAGEELTVYGDGSQTRSFCYVDDLVDGLIKLMEHAEDLGPVNLGNPAETTVLDLAQEILRLTKSQSHIVFHPLPEGDPGTAARCSTRPAPPRLRAARASPARPSQDDRELLRADRRPVGVAGSAARHGLSAFARAQPATSASSSSAQRFTSTSSAGRTSRKRSALSTSLRAKA